MLGTRKTRAGKLDRRIGLYQVTETRTASGALSEAWTLLAETWAEVRFPVTGQDELYMADQQTARTRADFYIRWRSGLTEKIKVRYDAQDYDILTITEEGRRNFLLLKTEKRALT